MVFPEASELSEAQKEPVMWALLYSSFSPKYQPRIFGCKSLTHNLKLSSDRSLFFLESTAIGALPSCSQRIQTYQDISPSSIIIPHKLCTRGSSPQRRIQPSTSRRSYFFLIPFQLFVLRQELKTHLCRSPSWLGPLS